MKHLWKDGLRRCHVCKEIKALTENNFSRSNKQNTRGFRYICKPCANKKSGSERRNKVLDAMGRRCQRCGLEDDRSSFFDIDHIIPIRNGRGRRQYSMSKINEYMVLCPNCHRHKTLAENGFR